MAGILTLTMNPAVDLFTSTPKVRPTHKLRCTPPLVHPGGGGINVARVVARLGGDVVALYPAGGITGQLLGRLLEEEAVHARAIPIAGETRQSFSAHEEESGVDYRFVLPGPQLSPAEWEECLAQASRMGVAAGWVVASGSLPPGTPADFYARLARKLGTHGVRLVLDTSGDALVAALEAGVYLVKPSLRELGDVTGEPLDTPAQRQAACQAIVRSGRARVVALSLGAEGAMVVSDEGAWHAPALQVQVVSTIGAGDSFVGGLVQALACGDPLQQAFRYAMAASAAALLSRGTALCRPQDVARLLPDVQVRALR